MPLSPVRPPPSANRAVTIGGRSGWASGDRLRTADRRSITKRRPVGGLSWRTNPPSLVANHVGIIGRRGTGRLKKIVSLTVIQIVGHPPLPTVLPPRR